MSDFSSESRRLKIVVVNQPMDMLIPPNQNSIGIWTYKTAPHIAKRHDVLVLGKRSAAQRDWTGQDDVRYEFVPPRAPNRRMLELIDRMLKRSPIDHLPSYAWRLAYLDYAVQAALAARRHGADVIHVHNFSQFVPTLRSICPDAKIVLHMACEWLTQLDYDVIDRRLAKTDLIVGCSDYITAKVAERFPHCAERCVTVYNGVEVERFRPSPTQLESQPPTGRLLFVGRVSPEKGVHDLLDAFVLVAARWPDATLDIAGPIESLPREFIVDISEDDQIRSLDRFYDDDGYEAHLRRRIPAEIEHRVRFLGAVPQDDLVASYAAADVLINPSYSESFGMSLVEALACETPVVATRTGGMVDVLGGEPIGVLVDRADPSQLADAIVAFLDDNEFRLSAGRQGRKRVEQLFGWDRIAAVLVGHYERIAQADVS